ncbi:hypothetical protein SAMN05216223_101572 [Actinacidiphila yanglinensis]|uniref:Integral membrane protein n=1 Tax=Actinacidiphila yanglinensis TaxID=310779 RepID=A0A1H5TLC6_9ACTN|nr:hypothetical protein [Actinacidiphila yanglinensis]SEF63576.1 hypothetical protein SAMN05216223_101572 [Actinacidiphila yanglinensis]
METMGEIRPRLRAARAALFAALCVTLSSTSHVLMSHRPLPLTVVGGAFAAVFALAFALGGRERGFWAISGVMVPVELAVDTVFTSGQQSCYGPSGGPVTGSWRSLHEAVVCHGGQVGTQLPAVSPAQAATAHAASSALPWLLLALHVTVGLLASWWLRRGEAALHRALRAVAVAAFRPLLFAASAGAVTCSAVGRLRPTAVPADGALAARPLLHSVVRRGPPVALAA